MNECSAFEAGSSLLASPVDLIWRDGRYFCLQKPSFPAPLTLVVVSTKRSWKVLQLGWLVCHHGELYGVLKKKKQTNKPQNWAIMLPHGTSLQGTNSKDSNLAYQTLCGPLRGLSVEGLIKKKWCTYTMEYYSATKKSIAMLLVRKRH